ncbi:MAG: hypothetical protein AAF502_09120 [Bacteroidota bacterium]
MSDKKEYAEGDIRAISQNEFFKLRILPTLEIDLLYVIIGSLQEYWGGYQLHEKTVDMFFVNEYTKAQTFKLLCETYLASVQVESDVKLTKVETGHSYIESKAICQILENLYQKKAKDISNREVVNLPPGNELFITPEQLSGTDGWGYNNKRYSYLIGALIKNKIEDKPAIVFANAGHKAELVIDILKEFSAFGDHLFSVNYYFGVPHATRINLSEDNIIWGQADAFIQLLKKETEQK